MESEEVYAEEDYELDEERHDDVKECGPNIPIRTLSESEFTTYRMDSPETEPLEWDSDQGTPQASRHPSLSPSNSRTKPFKTLNSVGSVHDTARAKRDAETAERYLTYVDQLPYKAESIEQAQDKLSHIVHNLLTAVHAQDWTVTFSCWSHRLECWLSTNAPMKREVRAQLAKLFYSIFVVPGMEPKAIMISASMFTKLASNIKSLDIDDLVLPWKPLYELTQRELYQKQRLTGVTPMLGTITSVVHCAQRFFPPHEALPMLKCIMPPFDGSDISTVLTVQTQMARWLPLSHPQEWLPTVFALWQSFNSTLGTAIWLDLMARTAELHLDPAISGPQHLEHYRQKAESPSPPQGAAEDLHLDPTWPGLRKYVSLFDEQQWQWITTECLRTMEVPVGSSSQTSGDFLSIAGAGNHDEQVPKSLSSFISTPPRTNSLAHIFVNCMMEDAVTMPPSALMTPEPSTPATPLTGRPTPALGGSRALDSLAKFIQATESFFHPSNIGSYSLKLVNFCFKLSAQFYHRWLLERKPTCRTPKAWRLTKEIRREFVLQLRTVMLLSMYVKDAYLMSLSHVTLRILAYLEPELIIPSVLERAVPALETTLETHRTIATLSSLATTAAAFLSRENAPFAAKHLAALLDLSIPGIDLNDPGKTRQTCVFITQAISQVTVFDDLNRPEYLQTLPQSKSRNNSMLIDGDGQEELTETQDEEPLCDPQAFGPSGSRAQEDKLLRESTQTFPDFTVRFFKAIFSIFENLPEPGKGGKAGGSSEETMLAAIHHLTEAICAKMSPRLFDDALRLFYEFVAHSPRSNCARVSGRLLSAFARARPSKTLSLFIPLCCSKIKQELDYGAASIPSSTTSTSPLTEDTTFQWYCYLLNSLITECGPALLPFADKVLALLREMLYRVRSERGYTHLGRILSSLLEDQASTWIHMYDTSLERDTDEFIAQSHLSWGQVYEAREAPVKWHVPSSEEIDVVMRTLREITVPALERLESLVSEESAAVPSDSTWAKEYARWSSHLRYTIISIPSLVRLPEIPSSPGEQVSDLGDTEISFIAQRTSFACSITLDNPSDLRGQAVTDLRSRIAAVLHESARYLSTEKISGVEKVDSVKMMISCMKTFLLDYPIDRDEHEAAKKLFEYAKMSSRMSDAQKCYSDQYWIRRARYYCAARQRLASFTRMRSSMDDVLILDLGDFSLSNYTALRKAAQRAIERVVSFFDGTRSLLFPKMFEQLKPGAEVDAMKGALYLIGGKLFGNFACYDWRWTASYILALLHSQHQDKASIQQLVRGLINETVIRLPEPHSLRLLVDSKDIQEAVAALSQLTRPADLQQSATLTQFMDKRVAIKEAAYADLVTRLLAISKDETTHWRYRSASTRFLRTLIRRDMPLPAELLHFMLSVTVSDLPALRLHGTLATSKMMHFLKLRTLSKQSHSDMILQKSRNPLKKEIETPSNFVALLQSNIEQQVASADVLFDNVRTGWLVWSQSVTGYAPPSQSESPIKWEAESSEALEVMTEVLSSQTWWDALAKHLAQELSRPLPSMEHMMFIKAIFQVFEDRFLPFIQPTIEAMAVDSDRHRMRAGLEMFAGVYRGSKHWPVQKWEHLCQWLDTLIPKITAALRPDTEMCADAAFDYCLATRDPRRTSTLVQHLLKQTFDPDSSEAFAESLKASQVHIVARNLGWPYEISAESFWPALASPYDQIRSAVSDLLRRTANGRNHPSFASVEELLRWCNNKAHERPLLWIDDTTRARFDDLLPQVERLREIRQPASTGLQAYDLTCESILDIIYESSQDHRLDVVVPLVTKLLPELLHMLEMLDNSELRNGAKSTLAALASLHFPIYAIRPTMLSILALLKTSESWRIKMDLLPVLQVFFFQHLNVIDEGTIIGLMDTLVNLLSDRALEVREAAATTLSGIVRCSQRKSIMSLKNRFLDIVRTTRIPRRRKANGEERAGYQDALIRAHSGVLGAAALIDAHPYNVPSWLPALLLEVMGMHVSSPAPVSTTVRRCLSDFKKSHQDSWVEDSKAFTEDQLMELSDLLIPPSSYYA